MNRNIKIIAVIFIAIIAALTATIIIVSDESDPLDEPNVPKEYRSRIIETEDAGAGMKVAVNKVDGYRITVPNGWLVEDTASFQQGLRIYSHPDKVEEENIGGLVLDILAVKDLGHVERFVPEWVEFNETEISDNKAYEASYGYSSDGGAVAYIFTGEDRYYFIMCTVFDDPSAAELLTQCRERVKTFEIIE